ncbi:mechanosensitive ion channel family protein [Marinobacter flavimaris]|jgi:MscS family membrane protein|uniref:Mechanosensitive ion channel family protein n=1 Tax=Marinobacter flavimaris TaxID=262076 RepID=A0A3D8H7Y1_9GAMM|nr:MULTISPECIES: mechanosensitive ion channel family protein [Marinobacter]MCP4065461.1 mechanosensitive ion channel family protein [Gammaproteobacteria bacterium]MCW9008213.1 mechanosensitive ion channel family protein [Marinobacter sp.]HAU18776.1 mechanosensitive ion channel family protein [Marinobacter adhaerens]PPI82068.1 mechanosensitive ion channel protein MscS [Marinobacter flavimaris]RDU42519.1 mechanosensitive ion channel family protein [Marinobacter flavimaris]
MIGDVMAMVNGWIENFGLLSEAWRVGIVVFALVFGTATVAYIASHIIAALERKFSQTKNLFDDALLHAARKPVVAFVWLQGVYWAAEVAHKYSEAEIFKANESVLQIGFIFVLVWAILRLIKEAEGILVSPLKMKQPMDYTTVNAVSKLSRAVVLITAVLIAMQSMGYSISGVLAFGGVGGIAVGFAAKDLLANFFGGFIIHLDRPFKVGDWVRSPDRNIEGTVEHIGWRLTTIRTFDKRPLYVPNAAFTTIAVENPSRMSNRRIYETIGIRYADVAQMATIVDDIRAMLQQHEDIESDETLIVNFLAFNASSLDIMVYCFTKTTQWIPFHEVKQDVLLKISDIIEGYGAEVAFPTRTLHLPEGVRLSGSQSDDSADKRGEASSGKSAQKSQNRQTTGDVEDSGESE